MENLAGLQFVGVRNVEKGTASTSYSATTDNIRVTVFPDYLEDESEPAQSHYSFAYTVIVENLGSSKVQLIRRHWIVLSGGAQYAEVKGDGVVGLQPVIEPGEGFQYTSGSVIKDPFGSMLGWYTFQDESGQVFDVEIPSFNLVCAYMIH